MATKSEDQLRGLFSGISPKTVDILTAAHKKQPKDSNEARDLLKLLGAITVYSEAESAEKAHRYTQDLSVDPFLGKRLKLLIHSPQVLAEILEHMGTARTPSHLEYSRFKPRVGRH